MIGCLPHLDPLIFQQIIGDYNTCEIESYSSQSELVQFDFIIVSGRFSRLIV